MLPTLRSTRRTLRSRLGPAGRGVRAADINGPMVFPAGAVRRTWLWIERLPAVRHYIGSRLAGRSSAMASRRTAVPGSVTLVSRVDVVLCKAATDLAKGRAWPDTEEVTGSNPVAPTNLLLTSGNAAEPCASLRLRGDEST
jgi:hypothetical protein